MDSFDFIRLLETRIDSLKQHLDSLHPGDDYRLADMGAIRELRNLRDYIQSGIESDLNAFENQSSEC
jgi:hypothetical protein